MTVGEAIRAGTITRDHIVKLAEGLFDGKREIPVGPIKVVMPALKNLSPHVREMIVTALLLAEAKENDQASPET